MPDGDGYPTEEELKVFKKWTWAEINLSGWKAPEVVEHIRSIWWAPDWGFILREGRDRLFKRKVMRLQLHTGGWSGNEEIIAALHPTAFWGLFWESSRRGGHYYFEIPWEFWKQQFLKPTG